MEMDVVLDFIEANFDLDYWEVENCRLLPRALLLTSIKTGGTVLVWKDLLTNGVCFSIGGDKYCKVYPKPHSSCPVERA